MTAHKIEQKITGFKVKTNATPETPAPAVETPAPIPAEAIRMSEMVERPEFLLGSTYKVKAEAVSAHALYITINDIILNEGTENEERRPYEIFINSKDMEHYQWVVAMTRLMSAVFRKGGDVTFLIEELKSVFDPRGGYWKKGSFMPSIVAEIGFIIERHLIHIGLLEKPKMTETAQAVLTEKRGQAEAQSGTGSDGYPANATVCSKCHTRAVVILDNCKTCLECGDSKCS